MGTRTTSSGAPGRFTADQPDGLNTPVGGFVPGLPPFIWITGGGTPANNDPAVIGMDRILDALTDGTTGWSPCQPNAKWALGGPGTTGPPGTYSGSPSYTLVDTIVAIDDAVAWARANLGATMDPPILMGVSNGWVCSIIYARDNPITGLVGILPVTAGKDGYFSEDTTLRGLGLRERIEDAWNCTYPTEPTDPKYSPYDDIANYPDLKGKVQAWYSANDPLLVSQQMSFLQRPPIWAEMHNLGAYGHLGTLFDSSAPVDHIDADALVAFVDGLL